MSENSFNNEDGLDLFDELNSLYEDELTSNEPDRGTDALLDELNPEQKEAGF